MISHEPKATPLSDRIATVLGYGLDPSCEVVSPQRALAFACDLIVEHHDNIEGKKLLASPSEVWYS